MPTGATLPFTTYRDTGIQSITNTLTPVEDENVVSEFLSQKSRTYLSGSYDSINTPYTEELQNNITRYTYVLSNSSDVISKIFLNFEVPIEFSTAINTISRTLFYDYINKVEVIVGSEVWQTLTGADIFSRNVTENYYNNLFDFQNENLNFSPTFGKSNFKYTDSFHGNAIELENDGNFNKVTLFGLVDLKLFSGSGNKLNSFLNCSAPNTEMTIRVYCNKYTLHPRQDGIPDFITGINTDYRSTIGPISTSLIVKRHRITDVEREYAQNNIINSLIYTSQNVTKPIAEISNNGSDVSISINLDSITINTSHLLLTMVMTPYLPELITSFTVSDDVNIALANSVYYNNYYTVDSTYARSGIFSCIKTAELFIDDSSVTGKLAGSYMLNCAPSMDLNKIAALPVYVIPLASTKFGNDSILFSKLSHKRLDLVIDKNSYHSTSVVYPKIIANVTAVGTNVITYSGGRVRKQFAN